MPAVTIGVVNYDGMATLPSTLESIRKLQYPEYDVLVVDNGSTDGSREWLEEWRPGPNFQCLFLPENRGSSAARQLLLEEAKSEYVFFLDNDILVEPDCLVRLVTIMRKVNQAAACHPEICDENDPTVYHYNGGWMNYLGVYLSRPKPAPGEVRPEFEDFPITSGGALLVDRRIIMRLGGYDRDYFFNMEDGDFTARISMAGYRLLNVPSAIVQHRSKPRAYSKVYFQVRNRWIFMTKLYSLRTLLLAAPALFLFELSQALFLLVNGEGKAYFEGNRDFLLSLPKTWKKRRAFQRIKRLPDRDWLRTGDMYLPPLVSKVWLMRKLVKVYSGFFNIYWRLIRPLC